MQTICFIYLLLWSICGTWNSSQQTSLPLVSTINMLWNDTDKILIKLLFEISMMKDLLFQTPKISKFVGEQQSQRQLKCNMFAFLPCLLNICRKFEFLVSQGSVGTCLRWGGLCDMGFVANFIRFPVVQKFWKLIWQSYREFKGGNFFLRHSVEYLELSVQQSAMKQIVKSVYWYR